MCLIVCNRDRAFVRRKGAQVAPLHPTVSSRVSKRCVLKVLTALCDGGWLLYWLQHTDTELVDQGGLGPSVGKSWREVSLHLQVGLHCLVILDHLVDLCHLVSLQQLVSSLRHLVNSHHLDSLYCLLSLYRFIRSTWPDCFAWLTCSAWSVP